MIFALFFLLLAWLVLGQKLFAWLAIWSVMFALWGLSRWALRRGRGAVWTAFAAVWTAAAVAAALLL